MSEKKKLVVAITGASGMIYANMLINKLNKSELVKEIAVVITDNAKEIWNTEIGKKFPQQGEKIALFENNDFMAPFASGSSQYNGMIVCPASAGILGRIAHGISNCLVTRAADVMLKERRNLILVIRETPYNLIHIKNMELVTLAGGIICPATPSFYSSPKNLEEMASSVVDRVLDLSGIPINTFRWGD